MNFSRLITFLFLFFNSAGIFGAEVDFTNRETGNVDRSEEINGVINWRIQAAAMAYNDDPDRPESCDKARLSTFISTYLDTNLPEAIEEIYQTFTNPSLQGQRTADTIYANMHRGFIAELLDEHGACCYPAVMIHSERQDKNITVGLDKIDHFLSNGFAYYVEYSETEGNHHQKENAAVALGVASEEGAWGLGGTGVKSYGDLAANYSGMHMYRDMLDGRNGREPIIRCRNGRYEVPEGREIDIRDYATEAWDEGINCNSYKDQEAAEAVARAAEAAPRNKQCPLKYTDCIKLRSLYPARVRRGILNPNCLTGPRGEPVLRVEEALGTIDKAINYKQTSNAMEGLEQ